MDAWERLRLNSNVPSGDAWEHLINQEPGVRPSLYEIVLGVRAELAPELSKIDAPVSSRVASPAYDAKDTNDIVDAIWDEDITTHTEENSTGEALEEASNMEQVTII